MKPALPTLFKNKNKIFVIILALLLIAAAATALLFYLKYEQAQKLLKNPSSAVQQETQNIVDTVGKLIQLPTDELPTIATVSDINKLKQQTFFQKAENGDKVLIYTKAKKAILFRPSINKVIDVTVVNFTDNTADSSKSPSRIAIYNGTLTTGLAKIAQDKISQKFQNIEFLVGNANNRNYTKTVVIDLSGNNKIAADAIAQQLQAQVGSMPDGENKPDVTLGRSADILVILGSDFPAK